MPFEERDWPEDFALENGNYQNICCDCSLPFVGHKRRVQCKACASPECLEKERNVQDCEWFEAIKY